MARRHSFRNLRRGTATPLPGDDLVLIAVPDLISVPWSIAVEAVANLLLEQAFREPWLTALPFDDGCVWWPAIFRSQASSLLSDAVARGVLDLAEIAIAADECSVTRRLVRLLMRLARWRHSGLTSQSSRRSRVEQEVADILKQARW